MAEQLKIFKGKRALIKSNLTRFDTFLVKFVADESTDFNILNSRIQSAESLLDEFNNIQFEIEILTSPDEGDIVIQNDERDSFENTYYRLINDAKKLLPSTRSASSSTGRSVTNASVYSAHLNTQGVQNIPASTNNINASVYSAHLNTQGVQNVPVNNNNNSVQPINDATINDNVNNGFNLLNLNNTNQNNDIKLPQVNLPIFDGALQDWIYFRDTFMSIVHNKTYLSDVNKFHYLRLALKDEAAEVLRDLQISDTSYEIAWKNLLDRYEDEPALISHHVRALINLPALTKETHTGIRQLHDTVTRNLRVLKKLGEPTDYWDTLIIHLIAPKLDTRTKRKWDSAVVKIKKPNLSDFITFLNDRFKTLRKIKDSNENYSQDSYSKPKNKFKSFAATNTPTCSVCQQNHTIQNCSKFLKLDNHARYKQAKQLRLCINCLRSNHVTKQCISNKCQKCGKLHHTLLHFLNDSNERSDNSQTNIILGNSPIENEASTSQSNSYCSTKDGHCTLLSTASVTVVDNFGITHNCRVLLDSGSQSNFVTNDFCSKLKLKTEKIKIHVSGLNCSTSNITSKAHIKIHSRINAFNSSISCLVLDNITNNIPCVTFDKNAIFIPPNLVLADPDFNISGKIDMLIGADIFWDLMCVGQIKLGRCLPILQKTCLGWILSGPLNTNHYALCNTSCNLNVIENPKDDFKALNHQLQKFWNIDQFPSQIHLSPEEQYCEEHFIKNTSLDESARFIVRFPLKEPTSKLGNSRESAEHRFYSLEKRFLFDSSLKLEYSKFINEYISLNHMTLWPNSSETSGFFLPHHGVVKKDSLTTKLRVVFDGSAKSSSGYSLNDIMMVGPTIQQDLFSILIRFRKHNFVLAADIAKMYRQVLVAEDQRQFQMILWRDDPSDPLSVYRLNTVTYGTASASYLAIRCLHEIGHRISSENPNISSIILNDFYVDDLLTGSSTIEHLTNIKVELTNILSSYGFPLRKFISNSSEVVSDKDQSSDFINLDNDEVTKTLGLLWHPQNDVLKYSISCESLANSCTKRTILSSISKIFDPLGLLSPVTITAKIILQKLWQLHTSWDESIPLNLYTIWKTFRGDLDYLNALSIPRHLVCFSPKCIELHGFSDASQDAYGACIYVRSLDEIGKYHSYLLCAKTRVAPLKTLTIPRLELCAALLLAELMKRVKTALQLDIDKTAYYSDSTITLSWINTSPHLLKIFIANRVSQIHTLSNPNEWRYISTNENPADLLSRGISAHELLNSSVSKLWLHGPRQLLLPDVDWEQIETATLVPLENLPEVRAKMTTLLVITKNDFEMFPQLNKHSSFSRLQRIFAYVLRFINITRSKVKVSGPLTIIELNNSLVSLIKIIQSESFASEIRDIKRDGHVSSKNNIANLSPFLDDQSILRVGGRLKKSNFDYEKKHPVLLPKNHMFSILLARHEHIRLLHAGPQQLLASLREKFWPLSGRNLTKKIVHDCVTCFRFNAKAIKHTMGELPSERITPSRPFTNCGIDYAGPVFIRDRSTRNYKTVKAYISLFICFSTKAIHLELVSSLTTESFLSALRRFMARRGKCAKIFSDNATNFIGADYQLKEFLKMSHNTLKDKLCQEGISWNFIPPKAPHFGGLWESGVKSVKFHIKRIIGQTSFTFEEYYTILTQIESCLNSRPLTLLSSDPNDPSPLTPAHFLIGEPLTGIPEPDYTEPTLNRLNRFELMQRMVQLFWSRWTKEYLSHLQIKTKWKETYPEKLKPDAIVLIKEDGLPPLKWLMGRVLQTFPGSDGVTRTATVKTSTGTYKRPAVKLCLLPISS